MGSSSDAPTLGENNGLWLTRPEFVGKRIDVKLVGIAGSKFPSLVNGKTLKHEGAIGFLVPLDFALKPNSLQRKGIKIRVRPFNHVVVCPADAVKPQQQMPSDRGIGQEKSRVIIIGPDLNNSWDRVGDYGETIPAAGDSEIVRVRFTRERRLPGEVVLENGNPAANFHLRCLCRALNEELEVDDWKIPPTDFDAAAPRAQDAPGPSKS